FLVNTHPPMLSMLFPYTTLFRSIVINGVAAGVFHIDRRTGAVANQQGAVDVAHQMRTGGHVHYRFIHAGVRVEAGDGAPLLTFQDRKSTRLNSSHVKISYAVFCL